MTVFACKRATSTLQIKCVLLCFTEESKLYRFEVIHEVEVEQVFLFGLTIFLNYSNGRNFCPTSQGYNGLLEPMKVSVCSEAWVTEFICYYLCALKLEFKYLSLYSTSLFNVNQNALPTDYKYWSNKLASQKSQKLLLSDIHTQMPSQKNIYHR